MFNDLAINTCCCNTFNCAMLISSFGILFMIPDLSCCCVENLAFIWSFLFYKNFNVIFLSFFFNITINGLSKYIPIQHNSNIFWIYFVNVKAENLELLLYYCLNITQVFYTSWPEMCVSFYPCLKIKLKMTSSIYLGVRKKTAIIEFVIDLKRM